jgi:hypothetical protein
MRVIRMVPWGLVLAVWCCGPGAEVEEVEVEVSPLSGRQGETLTLFVEGVGTRFQEAAPGSADGSTDPRVSISGDAGGVVLGRVIVDNDHRARIPAYIAPDAPPTGDGTNERILLVATAGRIWSFDFTVHAAPSFPRIVLEPDSAVAGVNDLTVDVLALEGEVSFGEDTVVSFADDSGVHVEQAVVHGPGHVRLTVRVDEEAPPGTSSVAVTSGGMMATHPFEVYAREDTRLWIDPAEGGRGTTLTVVMVVEGMTLASEDLHVAFPLHPGLAVDDVTWTGETSCSASVTIAEDAPVGTAQIEVSSDGREARAPFRVLLEAATEPLLHLHPAVVEQGCSSRDVHITGVHTHFSSAESILSIEPGEGIDVTGFWVIDEADQRAVARLAVDAEAPVGSSVLGVTTGEEVATGVLTVVEPPALTVTVEPGSVVQGEEDLELEVVVEGGDLAGAGTLEMSFPPGAGVRTSEPAVESSHTARITVDVDRTAPTGITLFTLELDGQTATAPFTVEPAAGAASFTLQPPYLSLPSGEVALSLEGMGTSWSDGETALVFSDPSLVAGELEVTDATHATAVVEGPPWLTQRRVVAYTASPGGIAAAWWTLLLPAHREVRFFPDTLEAGVRGTLTAVGSDTSFVDGLTSGAAAPGTGLRVGGADVFERDLATVQIEVSSDAPPGIRALTLATGGELALGTLRVLAAASPPSAEADPGAVVAGEAATVTLSGTDVSFGPLTTVETGAPAVSGLVTGDPVVLDVSTVEVDVSPAAGLAGTVVPLRIATDLEVVRACLAVVRSADDPHAHFAPLAVLPGSEATLTVTSRGATPVSFLSDPPDVAEASSGVVVEETRVLDGSAMEIDVSVDDAEAISGSAVQLSLSGAAYDWTLVVPVLDAPPTLSVAGSPELEAGRTAMELDLLAEGFTVDGPSLRAASPSRVLFVESISSTVEDGARLVVHTAIRESAAEATLYVLPEYTDTWAVPLALSLARAPLRVVGVPSTVLETVPAGGPDLVGFTPAAGESLHLWTVLDADVHAVPWTLLGSDGISVQGRVGADGAMTLPDTTAVRHYVRAGDPAHSGLDYWMSVTGALVDVDRMEAEPNDSTLSARGLSAPGGAGSLLLATVDSACDVDYYELPAGPPTCYEAVSTRWAGGTFGSPYLSLVLLDDAGAEVGVAASSRVFWDPVACTDGSGDARYLRVRSEAGTAGEYLLAPRRPLLVEEFDHGPFSGPWVEISAAAGLDLSGWTLEIVDGATGATRGTVDLGAAGTMGTGGLLLVASPSAPVSADLSDAALDQMIVPYAVRVCHAVHGACDAVQVGGSGAYGEGTPLSTWSLPAARRWSLDTDDNQTDFHPVVLGTPGQRGGLPVP